MELPFLHMVRARAGGRVSALRFGSSVRNEGSQVVIRASRSIPEMGDVLFFNQSGGQFSHYAMRKRPYRGIRIRIILSR